MQARIQILPESLINKIAAGEVVERPASVVKELLENALDAGAGRISVGVEEGGRKLIRVADDGSGIPADEAALAFAQHATSKIRTAEDLFAIGTMGFRGEALASIASVAHVTMVTRTAASQQGVRVEVMDSMVGPSAAVPCAAAVGTVVEVRDLFYSVPARRKFLKTDGTEFSHVFEQVLRCALPRPQVAFTLTHNGKVVLDLPAAGQWRVRVAEALGSGGRQEAKDFHAGLMEIDFEDRGVKVTGFAGMPAMARPTGKYQYVFLNGRYIRDRSLLHAMKEAYRGLIEPAAQPVGVLALEMDPAMFDVNVHPQKTEVRFRDSGQAYRSVLVALREKLLGSDLTPMVRTAGRVDGTPVAPNAAQRELAPLSTGETREVVAEFFKHASPVQGRMVFGGGVPNVMDDPSRVTVGGTDREAGRQEDGELGPAGARAFGTGTRVQGTGDSMPVAAGESALTGVKSTAPIAPPVAAPEVESRRFVQLHNTYIVAETGEGVVIIDQHALHERIIYEELFARATRGVLEGQRLLIPEILPVTPRHAAALEAVKPMLAKLGMEVEDFDGGQVAVQTFPSLLSKVSPREFLRDLLDRLLEYGGTGAGKLTAEELLHEVLDMASCKAAVKAGYPLSGEEIAALLARKQQVERSSNCPHGRPTTLRLTIGDLERQFKRK